MRSTLLPSVAVLLATAPLSAQLALPHVFGAHMVLQRESTVPIFGTSAAGGRVEVVPSWPGAERAHTTADAAGRFRVDVKTGPAGGPFVVTVASGNEAVRLEDVMLGEVWLCSGQSNMEWRLRDSDGGDAAIAAADRPNIRLFQVQNRVAAGPLSDVDGSWRRASPATVPDFSAVAWHFAVELEQKLGVPIGLVQSDWGGTPAEAWTRAEGLAEFPEFQPALARMQAMAADPEAAARKRAHAEEEWEQATRAKDVGYPAPGRPLGFAAVGLDDSAWRTLPVPGAWNNTPFASFDGVLWYRRTVEIPASFVGHELIVELGSIDDDDSTYFDGVEIGSTRGWNVARSYHVPARLVRGGTTTIAVRNLDTGGEGGFVGAAEAIRVRRVEDEDGKDAVSLAGTWRVHEGASMADLPPRPRSDSVGPGDPSSLWNGMIAPLAPFGIRGAIWYQGESNVDRFAQYRTLFPAMIRDWRKQFGRGDFPFYLVQIAPFEYGGDHGQAALLRDAQRRTLDVLPNVGMAVTMDIGNPRDIHPRDKIDVGHRLALWALARDYGQDLEFSGPLFSGFKVEGARLRVGFTHAKGLRTRSGQPPRHFEIAGSDGQWHAATATIEGETIVLWADGVAAPVDVRYAFGAADESDLENGAGLPASSFVATI
ncbi:MAG: sialate O-acetylesterase [Planctomycetota bacterium]